MKNNIINYNNLLNPYNTIEELKNRIKYLYLDSYGDTHKDLIEKRLDNTIFIFESDPKITKKFISENMDKIKDNRLLIKTEIEYLDYIKEEKKIEKNINQVFANYIKSIIYTDSYTDIEKVFNIDFDSYNIENNILLDKTDTPDYIKEKIIKRRNEYKIQCLEAGIQPITDIETIEKISRYKNSLELYKKIELIKNTIWGKKIKKRILNNSNFNISELDLANILYDKENSATTCVVKDDNDYKTICYIPLYKNIYKSSLDKILLHELRHVIETNENGSGISRYLKNKYNLLNEIRTEINAKDDFNKTRENIIFSKNEEELPSIYEVLIPNTNDFFEENKKVLNILAITNNVEKLEELYGRDELKLYDYYLNNILELILNGKKEEINDKIKNQLVKSLNSNYSNNNKKK